MKPPQVNAYSSFQPYKAGEHVLISMLVHAFLPLDSSMNKAFLYGKDPAAAINSSPRRISQHC